MMRAEQPRSERLVYDEDCGICTRFTLWIHRRAPNVVIVPSYHASSAHAGLTPAHVKRAAYWVSNSGGAATVERGHRAIGRALLTLGQPYSFAGWLLLKPLSPIAAVVYVLVARNRHRLGGKHRCTLSVDT